jgi:hypothetical protein
VANGGTEEHEAASGSPPEIDPRVEKAKLLWDEYKYRHDLVWKVLFQITTAAVVLSVVPYLAPELIVRQLERGVLIAPILAFMLVLFSMAVVNNELILLGKIRTAHRRLQEKLFGIRHKIPQENNQEVDWGVLLSLFGIFTNVYLIILVGLSLANVVICAISWVPCVVDPTQCRPTS